MAFDLGKVASEPVSRWMMLAYDDLYSIQYLGENLRPWWRRDGMEAVELLQVAAREYADTRAAVRVLRQVAHARPGTGRRQAIRRTVRRWPIGKPSPLTSWQPDRPDNR